ncbi:NUDIX hydrolase [candidate division WOR-3 bacterium]|nr:NUDIX hydrolase [candidate division WOR-3 bacterium]
MKVCIRCAAIILRGETVLLVRSLKSSENLWIPPGGKLQENDFSVFECAKREAFEESGQLVRVIKLVGLNELFDEKTKMFSLELFFLSECLEDKNLNPNGYVFENENAQKRSPEWFGREALKDLRFSPQDLILSCLGEVVRQ